MPRGRSQSNHSSLEHEFTVPPPESYSPLYAMHKYWGKKPYNVVRAFIEHFSGPGDVVFDPFCGSGVTLSEAVFAGRRALGVELNPAAIAIARELVQGVSLEEFRARFRALKARLKPRLDAFYTVVRDGHEHVGTHFIWKGDELREIWYVEPGHRRKTVTPPRPEDVTLARSFTLDAIPHFYPKTPLFENSRVGTRPGQRVCDLFSPRNLHALAEIFHAIQGLPDPRWRAVFQLCFTGCLGQASRMVFVVKRRRKDAHATARTRRKKEVGSWVIGYWNPEEHFEVNAWRCFENRFKRVYRGKRDLASRSLALAPVNAVEPFFRDASHAPPDPPGMPPPANWAALARPVQEILPRIPAASVDYVLTDPPHGNRQPYLELSLLWNAWTSTPVEYPREIVVSNASDRAKSRDTYLDDLATCFREIYRVLKPAAPFTLMFNSLDDDTWDHLLRTLLGTGFALERVDTLGYSARSVVQDSRKRALKTDFVFTFRKCDVGTALNLLTGKSAREAIRARIQDLLTPAPAGVETYEILNDVVQEFLRRGRFCHLSDLFDVLARECESRGNKWFLA